MRYLIVLFITCVFSSQSHSLSIVYNGLKCELEPTQPSIPAQSRFDIFEDLGGGNYSLLLTNGILIFKDQICIGSLGNIADETTEFQINEAFFLDAIAHFSNNILIISYDVMTQIGDIEIDNTLFSNGITKPTSYTLILDYMPTKQSFKLKSAIKIDGTIMIIGFPELGATTQTIKFNNVEAIEPEENIEFFIKQ